MQTSDRVGIFVDVENLTQWIKQDGLEQLIEELTSMGTIIVRRAYAKWTEPNVMPHQNILNRLGFELIHTFHPVGGKNAADIQIVVDVMEYAWRDSDLRWITLATGDSDFSPLFRRLREMGRQVIGAGPRSALSESVKSSCSRFIYLDREKQIEKADDATRVSVFDDAADLLEKALATFDEPAVCSALKARMTNIDSAFDEKQLGFKGFNDFVKQVDTVKLSYSGKAWLVTFKSNEPISPVHAAKIPEEYDTSNLIDRYRSILRSKGWRSVPLSAVEECYQRLLGVGAMTRPDMAELIISSGTPTKLTSADVKKVTSMFFKANLLVKIDNQHGPDGEENYWILKSIPLEQVVYAIDRAMISRLISGLQEAAMPLKKEFTPALLLKNRSMQELDKLINEAKQVVRQ
ncbi:NYN domain-containing protein [Methylicorpusculum sp.]|uniref:NYN domain-containing protein n=1 Tax=Methylicorpusculum sp. TaxID=2713644 RepID=UPI002724E97D|nr:NYN domain-containing protein [Methylicorpusculum sp.]MDO8846576.1 NYN domain-containing protein [Methylicorpusculum sp.]